MFGPAVLRVTSSMDPLMTWACPRKWFGVQYERASCEAVDSMRNDVLY